MNSDEVVEVELNDQSAVQNEQESIEVEEVEDESFGVEAEVHRPHTTNILRE